MRFDPVVYEHAAALLKLRPWDVSRDANLLVKAHATAYELYHHQPIVPGIDVYNVEAEAYGAIVEEPAGNGVPSIPAPPFSEVSDLLALRPFDPSRDGRFPLLLEAAEILQATCSPAPVRVPISGPFSIACGLLGFDNLLCATLIEPETVARTLDLLALNQVSLCQEAAARHLQVTIFESAATIPLLSPTLFRDLVAPPLARLVQAASSLARAPVACIIGGDALPVIDDIMLGKPGYIICPSETDQEAFLTRMKDFPDTKVRVNMNPGIFTGTDREAVRREVDRVWKLCRGLETVSLGSGVLPYEAVPETVLFARDYVQELTG
jgi:uroporphyrinogen decarboxylase